MLEQRFSDNEASKRDVCSFIEPRPPLISNPFMRPRPQKGTNLLELFEEDSECEEPELVQVYLRLKPCNIPSNLYEVRSDRCLITSLDTTTAGHGRRTQHNVSKMYTFSHIFGAQANQKEIFETVVKENLRKLPEGHNFTLLTYGASGSGKTYTLMGTVASPGLVPRSLEYVFRVVDAAQQPLYKPSEGGADKLSYSAQDYELQWVKRLRQVSAPLREKYRRMSAQLCSDMTASSLDLSNRTRHYVWVSFVEIYNEGIYDLLSTSDRKASSKLVIREDSNGTVYVKGATQAFVRTGEEAYDVMVAGKHNLQVAATGVHAQSSRSHCIFTITMLTETDAGVRISCVRLCDLAGCERARRTRNTGERMRESRAINSSLHVLERCLHTLRRRQRATAPSLVPYRESKLTRLLGAGLSGARGEAVSMVVTLNPAPEYAHETRHVLQLAAVARDIQINNTISEYPSTLESSQDTILGSSEEVMRLRSENERLHFELVQAQARNKELLASMEERQAATADTMRELVDEAKAIERQYYEAQMQALRTEMEDMAEEYESRLSKISASKASETPSKSLQKKIAQLMTDVAILEEKLSAEKLARARAEEEVQHLRACIEERDEKSYEDNAVPTNEDVMSVTDSDNDSEDDEDPCNESLEPTFKKEDINRSRLIRQSLAREQHSFDSVHSDNNCDVSVLEKSEDTIKDNDRTSGSLDETYATGNVKDRTGSFDETYATGNVKDRTCSLDDTYATGNESQGSKKRSLDSKERDRKSLEQDKDTKCVMQTDSLEADDNDSLIKDMSVYTEESKSKISYFDDIEISNEKNIETKSNNVLVNSSVKNICRGTYFVSETQIQSSFKNESLSNERNDIAAIESNDKVQNNIDDAEEIDEVNQLEIPRKASETLVSKIINSLKSTKGSNNSLAQFEQLEKATKDCKTERKEQDEFSHIKILKEKRTYFDNVMKEIHTETKESIKETVTEIIEHSKPIERRTYFDNIGVNIEKAVDKRLTEVANEIKDDDLRSPSIVKEDVTNDFEPSTIKRLLGESITRQPDPLPLINKNVLIKKHDSIDVFEGLDSPLTVTAKEVKDVEIVRKSIQNIVLHDEVEVKTVIPAIKIEQPSIEDQSSKESSVERNDDELVSEDTVPEAKTVQEKTHAVKSAEEESLISSNVSKAYVSKISNTTDNTIEEFENIFKDVTAPNVTEFEMLVSQEISSSQVDDTVQAPAVEEVKYNLRHKSTKKERPRTNDDTKSKSKKVEDEVLLESEAKCEIKSKCTKRSLRLKRRNNMTDEEIADLDKGEKLKDIVNLQCEFSDVTIDIPAPVKTVKDIPSPDKDETENLPPRLGIQSCPSKSVTRSRRKLFTPRAEPLEESFGPGDSNERVYVPRPSYHRPRARRKL